ncbi:LuxR C-terminal-related transcriptional regulator [Desulfitobacterium sp. AusDCA]|uniref:LuxR C-terminal-related transcriptional regulator n=1 Tax=Desulfitobacterium sp. AusDCA TaxID=3240383 RepID=UPI003DA71D2C
MIKVLMADENYLQMEGLKKLFEDVEDIWVTGTTQSKLANQLTEFSPDIVMMDLYIPIFNIVQTIHKIRAIYPLVKILILTNLCSIEAIQFALESGVSGYLLKQCLFSDIVKAIRAIDDGNSYFHPTVAQLILNNIVQNSGRTTDSNELDETLTERELEVLRWIAEGYTNEVIAQRLFISAKTVQTHRRNIMDKLGFHDRIDLVKYAIRKGIIALQ